MLKITKPNKFNWFYFCVGYILVDQSQAYRYSHNIITGKVFKIGLENGQYFFALLIWFIMTLLFMRLARRPNNWDIAKMALQLSLFGLFSNVVSIRIYGRVVDYINTPWFRTNLADLAIVASLITLAYFVFFPDKKAPTS